MHPRETPACVHQEPCTMNTTVLFVRVEDWKLGFPGGSVVKNPPANVGDMVRIPGPGRSHMTRSN